MKKVLLAISVLFLAVLIFSISTRRKPIDFTTQVKPILNKNCITCHGGVRQKGGFSLLFRDEALATLKSGKHAIIPGEPDHSEMIRRISLRDPEDRMPYKHDPLNNEDIQILTRWIKEGAPWGEHWAYVAVNEPVVPQPTTFFGLIHTKSSWAKNEVDHFIEQKWKEQDLKPSRQADKSTLLRRVSLDITGLLPSEKLADKFLADNSDIFQLIIKN